MKVLSPELTCSAASKIHDMVFNPGLQLEQAAFLEQLQGEDGDGKEQPDQADQAQGKGAPVVHEHDQRGQDAEKDHDAHLADNVQGLEEDVRIDQADEQRRQKGQGDDQETVVDPERVHQQVAVEAEQAQPVGQKRGADSHQGKERGKEREDHTLDERAHGHRGRGIGVPGFQNAELSGQGNHADANHHPQSVHGECQKHAPEHGPSENGHIPFQVGADRGNDVVEVEGGGDDRQSCW